MRTLLTIIALFFASIAQAQLTNKVLVSNDFRTPSQDAIVVKWTAEKVLYERGFNVFRTNQGSGDWVKLNQRPITPMDAIPAKFADLYSGYKSKFGLAKGIPEKDLHESEIIRAFITLDVLRSRELAELIGLTWYDATAQTGQTYIYKVEAITATGVEIIGESAPIQKATYEPLPAVTGIELDRKRKYITLRWDIDEQRSLATIVEKRTGGGAFEPMDSVPFYVAKSYNASRVLEYPKVFLVDTLVEKGVVYSYRFAAVDFFGQKGEYSEPVMMGMKGVEVPPQPFDFSLEADDRSLEIALNWNFPDGVEFLRGFVVYYRLEAEDDPKLLIPDTLKVDIRNHTFKVNGTGNYLITIAAVDIWGNVSESLTQQAQINDFNPPQKPANVKVNLDSSGIAIVSWDAVPDTDLDGYFIQRYLGTKSQVTATDLQYLNNKPTTTIPFLDTLGNKLVGNVYYAITAVDVAGNESGFEKIVIGQIPDQLPPSTPFIREVVAEEGQLIIHFMENVDADLKSFILMKRDDKGEKQNITIEPNAISYIDKNVTPGRAYQYQMVAEDLSGNKSDMSEPYEIFAPGEDMSILEPIKPKNIAGKFNKSKKSIELTWNQLFDDSNLGAAIYKGESREELALISPMLREGSFEDRRVKPGNTYYYQVRTYASNGTKHISDLIEVIIKEEKSK